MPIKARPLPPAADLWERFSYNPLTGELFGRKDPNKPLGCKSPHGYLLIGMRCPDNRNMYAHRVAWKWVTGQEPPSMIDHIDRNPANNRFWNLRPADRFINRRNRADYEHVQSVSKAILELKAKGMNNYAVGRALEVCEGTVRNVLRTCS